MTLSRFFFFSCVSRHTWLSEPFWVPPCYRTLTEKLYRDRLVYSVKWLEVHVRLSVASESKTDVLHKMFGAAVDISEMICLCGGLVCICDKLGFTSRQALHLFRCPPEWCCFLLWLFVRHRGQVFISLYHKIKKCLKCYFYEIFEIYLYIYIYILFFLLHS